MASEWYYTLNGQQAAAPASAAVLKQLAGSGQLQPTDLVWQEGMANWMPASSIKGLFGPAKTPPSDFPALDERPSSSAKVRSRKPAARPDGGAGAGDGAPDLHPLLVLLLNVCTGGLFGLFYAYRVCTAYSARAGGRAADSAGRPLGAPRHPLAVLVLSGLTAGFYYIYWVYRTTQECNAYLGRKDDSARTDLALMLLFPPYTLYLAVFRLPELVRGVRQQAKLPESSAPLPAVVFLNPCLIFALPLLGMAQQEALNQAWQSAP
jgi:hypothetical protein